MLIVNPMIIRARTIARIAQGKIYLNFMLHWALTLPIVVIFIRFDSLSFLGVQGSCDIDIELLNTGSVLT